MCDDRWRVWSLLPSSDFSFSARLCISNHQHHFLLKSALPLEETPGSSCLRNPLSIWFWVRLWQLKAFLQGIESGNEGESIISAQVDAGRYVDKWKLLSEHLKVIGFSAVDWDNWLEISGGSWGVQCLYRVLVRTVHIEQK